MARPLIFETPEDLSEAIKEYFETNDRPTLAGLAYALNIDRQTLYNYGKRDEFFDIIKRARDKVASVYEERLVYENSPTGVIFALKNMGWQDKKEVESTNKTEHSFTPRTLADLYAEENAVSEPKS